MSSNFKPAGYTSVSPYLIVPDAAGAIDFLVRVFDAVELRRFADDAGRILHAEVRLDDSVIMMGQASPDWPPEPAHVHVYVPDVDGVYRRALAEGATSLQQPVKKEDDDKRGGVKDTFGTTWWISTKVA